MEQKALVAFRQDPASEISQQDILRVLSFHGARQLPTAANIDQLMQSIAEVEMVYTPAYPVSCLRQGLDAYNILWKGIKESTILELYFGLLPTSNKVIACLDMDFSNGTAFRFQEEAVAQYLEYYIVSLQPDKLADLLGCNQCDSAKHQAEGGI